MRDASRGAADLGETLPRVRCPIAVGPADGLPASEDRALQEGLPDGR